MKSATEWSGVHALCGLEKGGWRDQPQSGVVHGPVEILKDRGVFGEARISAREASDSLNVSCTKGISIVQINLYVARVSIG